ncbi:MAG: cytochrome-c peroxidase [Ferruginibacter sp.]|nr:cytochrome-c peroxidase [Ferruginibacter sp.]
MNYRIPILILAFIGTGLILISAGKEDGLGAFASTPLKWEIPKGFPKPPTNIFAKNKLTEEGFQLGRKLFYEGKLSKDGETSCGSCHQQFAAFSTFDHDLSHGVNNSFSTRNAPALFNLAWMREYHWDGGINHIEVQPLSPMLAANEMGETLDSVLFKLKKDTAYRRMFKAAFGDPAITSQRMLKALAQFTGSLVSANSKYDKVKRGEASFNAPEEKGYALYKANCAACHMEPLFTDYSYRNNGLALNRFTDIGRQQISGLAGDSLKFKVPSLRNVQLSYPYMHDGRIFSLPQVLDHYRLKINRDQPTLDPILQKPIVLSDREKNELLYFLYTLTDTSFTKNPRFAAPAPITIKH